MIVFPAQEQGSFRKTVISDEAGSTMIDVDGSYGEGGGQILRTALALSCLYGQPFRIHNLRQGRAKPGLMPQHLMGVRAAQHISGAEVTGDRKGSTDVVFCPRKVVGGDFSFDIGTAGSTSLVLQAVLPALLFCSQRSTVTLMGGTHVHFSPSFHYLAGVFAPFLRRLGFEIGLHMETCGFYPKGGGRVRGVITPGRGCAPLQVAGRGNMVRLEGCSAVGNLPVSIAERQENSALGLILPSLPHANRIAQLDVCSVPTPGTGTFIFLKAESEHSIAGFTALGERGKRAEAVGEEAAREFLSYYETEAALDPHLADQIVLYLSLCEKSSSFTTSCITQHLLTNLWVIGLFHPFRFRIVGEVGAPGTVFIN